MVCRRAFNIGLQDLNCPHEFLNIQLEPAPRVTVPDPTVIYDPPWYVMVAAGWFIGLGIASAAYGAMVLTDYVLFWLKGL